MEPKHLLSTIHVFDIEYGQAAAEHRLSFAHLAWIDCSMPGRPRGFQLSLYTSHKIYTLL